MKREIIVSVLCVVGFVFCIGCSKQTVKELPLDVLKDKIKGGWAGQ